MIETDFTITDSHKKWSPSIFYSYYTSSPCFCFVLASSLIFSLTLKDPHHVLPLHTVFLPPLFSLSCWLPLYVWSIKNNFRNHVHSTFYSRVSFMLKYTHNLVLWDLAIIIFFFCPLSDRKRSEVGSPLIPDWLVSRPLLPTGKTETIQDEVLSSLSVWVNPLLLQGFWMLWRSKFMSSYRCSY